MIFEKTVGQPADRTIPIGNKFKVFGQFFQMFPCYTHGENARTNTTIIRYLITKDGTTGDIHNEPDVGFDASDFDIGFIRSEHFASGFLCRFVIVVIYKWLNTNGS